MRTNAWLAASLLMASLAFVAAGGTPAPAPVATGPAATLPAGWQAGLGKEIAGITPLAMNLWKDKPPGYVEGAPAERDDGTGRIWDVNVPGILVYLPKETEVPKGQFVRPSAPLRPCIVECMGGSYTHLTRLAGADDTVPLFVPKGIVVVSLKYRLNPPSKNVAADALADGQRAMRLVRAHAREWGIDTRKVGMLGWSAGANLILNQTIYDGAGMRDAADEVERESCRPDFVALLSPWPNGKDLAAYPMPARGLPPAFIASARDDKTAPFDFAEGISANWKRAGGSAEFLAVDTGGHAAFELSSTGEGTKWPEKFLPWLEKLGMWKPVEIP